MSEETTPGSTGDKIDKIMASGWKIAWDGCHKIYFLPDAARERAARDNEYWIFSSTDLPDLITRSCSLVFVSKWGLNNEDFEHKYNIEQGTQDIYAAAEARCRRK